jgi:hypothetical protein
MRSTITTLLTGFVLIGTFKAATPVGTYRLTKVDGVRVPMVWRESGLDEGGPVQLHWVSGRAEFRRDGNFEVTLTSMRTGRGLAGTPESIVRKGTWRLLSGFRVELRFSDGHTTRWGPSDLFSRLTLQARWPDLEGQYRLATLLLVRD